MKLDKKPVVADNLSNNIVVYGEDESEAYRSQAANFLPLVRAQRK